ncbi:hypothetical protein AKJ42_02210 [candidate division MSBL1 archaeon SCGC-AAA261C02]|uniref:MGS-like domain-containing protein n=1 Tax=candidate division MSBL1 archaeon SCGC-AAA261C02 TaxID=1698272 RepID=A0A133V0I6_9EURY|nr:hypothetical protein AKJ42_02210 [candidate division MSBL1 archaeon SCGC-AAA261C02]
MLESVIISVYDKKNLKSLMKGMRKINSDVRVFSSGETASAIKKLGYEVTKIPIYTDFPESPGGLTKTLHPKVHGGILLDRDKATEKEYLEENNIRTFNLVVCNLYPFEKTISRGAPRKEIVENIDIGGQTLIRSAAKGALRHGKVAPVVDPEDYEKIIEEMTENDGELSDGTVIALAHKAFDLSWKYEEKIRNWTEELVEG